MTIFTVAKIISEDCFLEYDDVCDMLYALQEECGDWESYLIITNFIRSGYESREKADFN